MPGPDPPAIPLPPSRAVRLQQRANRSTRDHWVHFAPHREKVHALVVPDLHPPGTGRLCVVGAGNCNDVDLHKLAEAFSEVHLVDIDGAALSEAVRRQGVDGNLKLRLHGDVDLTGIAARFATWEKSPPSDATLRDAAREAAHAPPRIPALGGPFDVVLSPCLLSQLVGYAGDVLGREHPRRRELLAGLRTGHVRTLVDLLAPGGLGVLVCDVTSSEGEPALGAERKPDLDDLLDRVSHTSRHFDGLAPHAIVAAIQSDPLVSTLVTNVQRVRPWLCRLGPRRTFLVHAICFRKSRGTIVL